MKAATFRKIASEKMMAKAFVECYEVDKPEYGMRKIDYYSKKANKLANVWRQGRRNFMYSK